MIPDRQSSGRRRLLVIAPEFYPCQVISAHRTGKFCKYLPEFGWDVSVVTIDVHKTGWPIDPQLAEQVDHVEHILAFYPFSAGVKAVLRSVARVLRGRPSRTAAGKSTAQEAILIPPDKDLFWVPWAVAAGLPAARRAHAIYATSPPASVLLIGAVLKRLTGRPLLVDLRDPWTVSHLRRYSTRVQRWADRRLEAKVFRSADAIICNTRAVERRYRQEYPHIPPERFCVIPNGFDPGDFKDLGAADRVSAAVRIGYFGKVYAGRSARTLFEAAARGFQMGRIAPEHLEFVFFGPSGAPVEAEARECGIPDRVRVYPTLPYRDALRQMAACDALLILGSSETDGLHVPGKTFEYLALGKPVVALGGEGALSELMREHGFGMRIPHGDIEAAGNALTELVREVRAGRSYRYVGRACDRFSRRELTRALSEVLDRVAGFRDARQGGRRACPVPESPGGA